MKISPLQYFFAENWLLKIWIAVFITVGIIILYTNYCEVYAVDVSISAHLSFTVLLVLVTIISYLISLVVGSAILPPVFRYIEKINGSPFKNGDRVEILKGKRRGQIATIYDVWSERYQAGLDIGVEAKDDLADVYCFTEFRKYKSVD